MKRYFVYIMSNKSRRLYVGITSKLFKRVFQHRYKLLPGFTSRYTFDMLVYYEEFSQVASAITREKEIKGCGAKRNSSSFWLRILNGKT